MAAAVEGLVAATAVGALVRLMSAPIAALANVIGAIRSERAHYPYSAVSLVGGTSIRPNSP
ncbi:hypothetical protein SAMN04515665_11990 [Blastococcus sp. DSM 46786]|nr:hypothetical protein SAMN04515665_11990 [Blastococcus sp. DSM 46786]